MYSFLRPACTVPTCTTPAFMYCFLYHELLYGSYMWYSFLWPARYRRKMIENQVLLSNRTYSEVRTDAAKNGFETPSGDSGPGPSFSIYTSYRMRRLVVGTFKKRMKIAVFLIWGRPVLDFWCCDFCVCGMSFLQSFHVAGPSSVDV